MGDLNFISDIIYGLKMDMGQLIKCGTRSVAQFDPVTGARNTAETFFYIQNAVYLPINKRGQFLRAIGNHREGYLEVGQREVLIDRADIPSGKTIKAEGGFIEIRGKRGDIVRVEDYENAIIVIIKEITGMPS